MFINCEYCDFRCISYDDWMDHLLGQLHQEKVGENVDIWSDDVNERSIIITFNGKSKPGIQDVCWYFANYGLICDAFFEPSMQFCVVQLDKKDYVETALTSDHFLGESTLFLKCKAAVPEKEWLALSSTVRRNQNSSKTKQRKEVFQELYLKLTKTLNSIFSIDSQLAQFEKEVLLKPTENVLRQQLLKNVNIFFRKEFPMCVLSPYGSFLMGLGNQFSTLDIYFDCLGTSVNLGKPSDKTASGKDVMEKFRKYIGGRGEFCNDVVVTNSFTSCVNVTHKETGVKCSFTFENVLPVQTSKMIALLLKLDSRLPHLFLFMRYWAEYHQLTGPQLITNYSLNLLILVFLAKKKIIPSVSVLQSMSNENIEVNGWNTSFCRDDTKLFALMSFIGTASYEKDPVTGKATAYETFQLACEFFKMYAHTDLQSQVVCSLIGEFVPKAAFKPGFENKLPNSLDVYIKYITNRKPKQKFDTSGLLCIQDPFDLLCNVSKAVPDTVALNFQFLCAETVEHMQKFFKSPIPKLMDIFKASSALEVDKAFSDRNTTSFKHQDVQSVFKEEVLINKYDKLAPNKKNNNSQDLSLQSVVSSISPDFWSAQSNEEHKASKPLLNSEHNPASKTDSLQNNSYSIGKNWSTNSNLNVNPQPFLMPQPFHNINSLMMSVPPSFPPPLFPGAPNFMANPPPPPPPPPVQSVTGKICPKPPLLSLINKNNNFSAPHNDANAGSTNNSRNNDRAGEQNNLPNSSFPKSQTTLMERISSSVAEKVTNSPPAWASPFVTVGNKLEKISNFEPAQSPRWGNNSANFNTPSQESTFPEGRKNSDNSNPNFEKLGTERQSRWTNDADSLIPANLLQIVNSRSNDSNKSGTFTPGFTDMPFQRGEPNWEKPNSPHSVDASRFSRGEPKWERSNSPSCSEGNSPFPRKGRNWDSRSDSSRPTENAAPFPKREQNWERPDSRSGGDRSRKSPIWEAPNSSFPREGNTGDRSDKSSPLWEAPSSYSRGGNNWDRGKPNWEANPRRGISPSLDNPDANFSMTEPPPSSFRRGFNSERSNRPSSPPRTLFGKIPLPFTSSSRSRGRGNQHGAEQIKRDPGPGFSKFDSDREPKKSELPDTIPTYHYGYIEKIFKLPPDDDFAHVFQENVGNLASPSATSLRLNVLWATFLKDFFADVWTTSFNFDILETNSTLIPKEKNVTEEVMYYDHVGPDGVSLTDECKAKRQKMETKSQSESDSTGESGIVYKYAPQTNPNKKKFFETLSQCADCRAFICTVDNNFAGCRSKIRASAFCEPDLVAMFPDPLDWEAEITKRTCSNNGPATFTVKFCVKFSIDVSDKEQSMTLVIKDVKDDNVSSSSVGNVGNVIAHVTSVFRTLVPKYQLFRLNNWLSM